MQEHIGPLKIVVCIKQVPLLSALRFDTETRRLVREGALVIEHIHTSDLANHIRTRIITEESCDVGMKVLESAQIILGMGEPENYPLVYQLAALLNAAI